MRPRAAVIMATLAGCAFDPAGLGGPTGSDGGVDAAVDAAPPRACPPSPDVVGCYRFEVAETAAQPFDESSYGNHGLSSGVSYVAGAGGRGAAMQFAPGASVVIPDSASLDVIAGVTMEGWLLVDALPAIGGRAGLLDNNGQYGLFLAPDSQLRCAIGSATAIGLAVPVGVWTHVGCTYDGATIQLYQSGEPGASTASTGQLGTGGVDGLGLGQNVPSGDHLQGALDDVRVWNRALSGPEMCAVSEACPTP
jgi:hypothetical protein